jgi:segregation and condensation protein A
MTEALLTQEPQQETPFAIVKGQAFINIPKDLYIPPEALRIFLETFEGPLDLLLYLIKQQNIDILDISVAEITRQYMKYVEMMQDIHFELTADYLVMAAALTEIKSEMLLPRPPIMENEEADPRSELIRRLQEYERFKKAAQGLDTLPREERDVFRVTINTSHIVYERPKPTLTLDDLLKTAKEVFARENLRQRHMIPKEIFSIKERMSQVLTLLSRHVLLDFTRLFIPQEGRMGVVVTFLAILELTRESLVDFEQKELFGPLCIKIKAG